MLNFDIGIFANLDTATNIIHSSSGYFVFYAEQEEVSCCGFDSRVTTVIEIIQVGTPTHSVALHECA